MARIHIFRTGRHTANSGQTLAFSEGDLEGAARAYDPALHEAPLVVGHPATNAPAYGWVKALEYSDGQLSAEPQQVDPDFQEMVNAGRFKKVSASFYLPDSPQNPKPGGYYLRHVGFLGAQPPAVKGLKDASFAASEEGVVVFDEMTSVADIFARLRDWIIGKFGLEEADQALPRWDVDWLWERASEKERNAEAEAPSAETKFEYSEGQVDPELEKKAAELAAREAALAAKELEAKQAGALAFAEGLVREGRVAPVHAKGLAALIVQVDGTTADFGEGEKPATEWLKGFLGSLPPQVSFGERAKPGPAVEAPATADFTVPEGCTVNPDNLGIHQKAKAYQRAHPGVDYPTAVIAVWN